MKSATLIKLATVLLVASLWANVSHAVGDDFNTVVKMIEQFYNVKHEGLPFLAKAAMKAVGVGAKVKGGEARVLAEAGSIKSATFEDQEFNGDFVKFRNSLKAALKDTWTPMVQTISVKALSRTTSSFARRATNSVCWSYRFPVAKVPLYKQQFLLRTSRS